MAGGWISRSLNGKSFLTFFWHSPCEPKKSCFRWLLLLKKLVVCNTLPRDLGEPIWCDFCSVPESYEHLFFNCAYARCIWSIFLGSPVDWNCKPGLSWSEILAGYVESFDFKMNSFWSVLTCEILWFLWKERNSEIFQKRRRQLTEFGCKLTHFHIMSQVAAALEISRDRFMILMREGQLLIHKEDIVSCQYFSMHKDMLRQRELDSLNQFIKDMHLEDRRLPGPDTQS